MSHDSPLAMTRRRFIEAAGMAAMGVNALAQNTENGDPTIVSPSETFGSVPPEEVGVSKDVETRIVAYLQPQIDAGVTPGAFVAAVRNGKVFLETHLGTYCNRKGRDVPYDGRALHPVHSVSKMVSATVVAMAWQDGLIDIDAPAMQYVPEFGCEGKEHITIRQLMAHAAGIPTSPKPMTATTEEGWKASVQATCKKTLEWEPESRTLYHAQTGMLIAAEAVRRASDGKTWNQICRERLFRPLGLSSFTYEQPPADLPLACVPRLSAPATQWQRQISGFYGLPGAGLKATPADILKFLAFHCQKGTWKGETLLKERYWSALHSLQFADKPNLGNWGLGMMVRGENPAHGGLDWFGLRQVTRPGIFTHAGTDVALAAGDPETNVQVFFMVTDSPAPRTKTSELRGTVLATIFSAIA